MADGPYVLIGAIILIAGLAAAPGGDVDRMAMEAARWAVAPLHSGYGHPEPRDYPRDIGWVLDALEREKHQDPVVQARVIPLIYGAIASLGDDDTRWNARGARHFLAQAGDLAVPFLEMKLMTTGDQQQRILIVQLLLQCDEVSAPREIANGLVESLRHKGCNGIDTLLTSRVAFRRLARSDGLLDLAVPKLIQFLGDKDPAVRINAAQLLCVAGGAGQTTRIVGELAPLLDDDEGTGSACSVMAMLGLLGEIGAPHLRFVRSQRDAQGRMLVDHLLAMISGPRTPFAACMTFGERYTITMNSLDPATDPTMATCMRWCDRHQAFEGPGDRGPWWYMRHVLSGTVWSYERGEDIDMVSRVVEECAKSGKERVARMLLERSIANMPRGLRSEFGTEMLALLETRIVEGPVAWSDPEWCRGSVGR